MRSKNKLCRAAALLTALGWMALIFGFSAQTGEESGGLSGLISRPVTAVIEALFGAADYEALYLQVDGAVRMAAHFTEYAILGALLQAAVAAWGGRGVWLSWLAGVAYAVLDEWHQSYSPGRACDWMDMEIDALGVLCGVMTAVWLMKRWRSKHDDDQ